MLRYAREGRGGRSEEYYAMTPHRIHIVPASMSMMLNREGRVGLNIKYIEWVVVWMSGSDGGRRQQEGPDARNKKQHQTNTQVKIAAKGRRQRGRRR